MIEQIIRHCAEGAEEMHPSDVVGDLWLVEHGDFQDIQPAMKPALSHSKISISDLSTQRLSDDRDNRAVALSWIREDMIGELFNDIKILLESYERGRLENFSGISELFFHIRRNLSESDHCAELYRKDLNNSANFRYIFRAYRIVQ